MSCHNRAVASDELDGNRQLAWSDFGTGFTEHDASTAVRYSVNDVGQDGPSIESLPPRQGRHSLLVAGGAQPAGSKVAGLIPEGLGPDNFLQAIKFMVHPMEADPVLHPDVEAALRRQAVDCLALIRERLQMCIRVRE